MVGNLKNVAKVPDLRNKVLFTLGVIVAYRLGCFIPAPGVDLEALQALKQNAETGGVFAFLQLFSGQALTNLSLFALGIMPYITASIIIQILGVVIPKLEQWQNQGAVGQRKITQWTRYLTIAIACMQGTGMAVVFHQGGGGFGRAQNPLGDRDIFLNWGVGSVLLFVLTLATGTAILMWLGELVTQKGIGNGMSLIIFASVVSSLPGQLGVIYSSEAGMTGLVIFLAGFLVILFAIVFVEQGQRRIPVQFAKRQVGRRMIGGQNTYIPLKVNQSGVIPIIFASSVLYLPQLLSFVLPTGVDSWGTKVQNFVNDYVVKPDSLVHMAFFGLLILAFAYFYTAIIFDPVKQADQIRKQSGFIPGIRPGPATERYLAKVLSRITLPGAVFVAVIALVPSLLLTRLIPGEQVSFSGITILIAVGVALETMKQIDSQLMMRNYEGFLK